MPEDQSAMIDREIEIRIDQEFDEHNASTVKRLFHELAVPERQRVYKVILDRSNGDIDSVRSFVKAAKNDYRDVLIAETSASTDKMTFSMFLVLGFLFIGFVFIKSCMSHS